MLTRVAEWSKRDFLALPEAVCELWSAPQAKDEESGARFIRSAGRTSRRLGLRWSLLVIVPKLDGWDWRGERDLVPCVVRGMPLVSGYAADAVSMSATTRGGRRTRAGLLSGEARKLRSLTGCSGRPRGTGSVRRHPLAEAALMAVR